MSLFTSESSPSVDPDGKDSSSQAPNAVDQLLQGIKNENGEQKYSSVEDALKGAGHAQEFIATLKKEKEQLEATVKSQEQLEQLLAKKAEPKAPPAQETAPQVAGISAEDVVKIMEQRKLAEASDANLGVVEVALKDAFGAAYQEALNAKITQLGLTPALVDNMAKTSPDALLKLLDVKSKPAKAPLGGSQSTAQFTEEKAKPRRFDPFQRGDDPKVTKWRESVERTNAQMGLK